MNIHIGTLPMSYANWFQINIFEISNNNFYGTLPALYATNWKNITLFDIHGNNFNDGVWRNETEIIVNEQFLKHLKISSAGDALDKIFLVDSLELKIVGVLKDFHFRSLRTAISPLIFRMNPGQANYAATKAGVIGFSKSLAREVARDQSRDRAFPPRPLC